MTVVRPNVTLAVIVVVIVSFAALTSSAALAADVGTPKANGYRLQIADDVLTPLDPIQPQTAAEQAHIDALAWYMTGRLKLARNDFQGAFEAYRKAVGVDPTAIEVYRELIPLAFQLKKTEEAVKFSFEAVELDPSDYRLLRNLARHMARVGKLPQSVELLHKAIQSEKLDKNSSAYVMLHRDVGFLLGRTGDAEKAADAYEIVFDARLNPKKYNLDMRTRRALGRDPVTTYERIGQVFLQAKRPKRAIAAFERAAQARNGKPGTLSFNLAQVYLQTDQTDKALAELQKYFDAQLQSKGRSAYQLLAELLKKLGKSDDLIGRLETLAKQDPRNSSLQYFLADQYASKNRLKDAEDLYKKTLSDSGDAEGYAGLARVYRQQRRPEELLDALVKSLKGGRGLAVLEAEMTAIGKDEKLLDGLLAAGRKLIGPDAPKLDFAGSYLLAKMAAKAEKNEAAIEFFRFALGKVRGVQAAPLYEEFGQFLLFEARNYAEAVKAYQDAVARPALARNPLLFFRLSLALELNGQTKEAFEAVQTGRKIADITLFDYQEAWIYYHSRQYDKAIPLFEKVIASIKPDDPQQKDLLQRSQFSLSNIYVQQGQMRKGEAILEKILAQEPDNVSVNNDLGYLYADQGKNLEKAEKMIRKAIKAEPENAAYLDSMGWVLFKLGKFDEAVPYLKKAVEKPTGGDSTILDHLGDCYDRLQQPEKAKELWQQAFDKAKENSNPDKKLVERIEQKLKKAGAGRDGR